MNQSHDSRMNRLHQLTYSSKRVDGLTDSEIVDDIVLPSLSRNRANDITGCLWFDRERFVQILEGDPNRIHALFDVIRTDDRHHGVEVLASHPIDRRSFLRFHMRTISNGTPESLAHLFKVSEESRKAPVADPAGIRTLVERAVLELSAWPISQSQ